MIFVFVLILLLIVIYINRSNFTDFFYIHYLDGYTNFPWWNTRFGNTSNMSYDLRGDPLIIPRTNYVWNNSSTFPIYNKSI